VVRWALGSEVSRPAPVEGGCALEQFRAPLVCVCFPEVQIPRAAVLGTSLCGFLASQLGVAKHALGAFLHNSGKLLRASRLVDDSVLHTRHCVGDREDRTSWVIPDPLCRQSTEPRCTQTKPLGCDTFRGMIREPAWIRRPLNRR
jgi:hypothetical protein